MSNKKGSTHRPKMSNEQRARRLQQIMFALLALLVVASMLISLIAR